MKCPECGDENTSVIESRFNGSMTRRRRRRACACGHRFSTIEMSTNDFDLLQDRIGELTKQVLAMNTFKSSFRELFDKK